MKHSYFPYLLQFRRFASTGDEATTLVVLTADHGGVGKKHGGLSKAEIEIPILFAGPGVARGKRFAHPLGNNTQRRNTGVVINPPIEGIQEFKMITSGFSAEYGRYAGGVTAVTKSGTNRLRGSLYEFLRNDALDATGYFDATKSKLRRNQFGATVSGPVWIPKLYNGRNRIFFLFTWESLRLVDSKTQRGIVPDPGILRGDFSKAADAFSRPLRITDSLARAPFPNNQIPPARVDPVPSSWLLIFPLPTASSTPSSNGRSPLPIFGLGNTTLDLLSYVRYLRTITPTMFLELSANFSRKTNNQVWPLSGQQDWSAATGFRAAAPQIQWRVGCLS